MSKKAAGKAMVYDDQWVCSDDLEYLAEQAEFVVLSNTFRTRGDVMEWRVWGDAVPGKPTRAKITVIIEPYKKGKKKR